MECKSTHKKPTPKFGVGFSCEFPNLGILVVAIHQSTIDNIHPVDPLPIDHGDRDLPDAFQCREQSIERVGFKVHGFS